MLISAVMPIMSVYRLPQGQYGYSGHVVNLPQDVASFAQSLPLLPSNLDVIIVRKEGANQSHRDFRVRRGVVHRALQWLVTHNQHYRALGVTIDTTALAQLPQDGNVSQLVSVTEDCSSPDNLTDNPAIDSPDMATEDDHDHLPQSFVPVAVPTMTEQEAVQQSVQQGSLSSHAALMWPSIGGMPLNEFTTEGYFTCAFPTLFPTGTGTSAKPSAHAPVGSLPLAKNAKHSSSIIYHAHAVTRLRSKYRQPFLESGVESGLESTEADSIVADISILPSYHSSILPFFHPSILLFFLQLYTLYCRHV